MLYDPKWEQQTQPSLAGLIAWLEKQPAETAYNKYDYRKCLMAQYHYSIGAEPLVCLPNNWMVGVAFQGDQTYGAALERAKATLSKGHG